MSLMLVILWDFEHGGESLMQVCLGLKSDPCSGSDACSFAFHVHPPSSSAVLASSLFHEQLPSPAACGDTCAAQMLHIILLLLLLLLPQSPSSPWRCFWEIWWPGSRWRGPRWTFTSTTPWGARPKRGRAARFCSGSATVRASVWPCWAVKKASCPPRCPGAPPRDRVSGKPDSMFRRAVLTRAGRE